MQTPVDVVIPVYNAPDDARRCIDSVLAHTACAYRLLLIDDASPDTRVAELFDAVAERKLDHVVLMKNARNLGFTATANRGFAQSRADVVLLNSDAIVSAGWLDALTRCARSDPRIATVTPFSNNAEICSFPRFCENNEWPEGADLEPVRAALADAAVPTLPDLPTGVGFCMYVRREVLDEIGAFDMAFGAGYGEENDFCLRAAAAGWRNVLADDAFVVHVGGRSFAGRKDELGSRNVEILSRRYPHYLEMVRQYVAADPLRPIREAAQLRLAASPSRGVHHAIHDHGEGTDGPHGHGEGTDERHAHGEGTDERHAHGEGTDERHAHGEGTDERHAHGEGTDERHEAALRGGDTVPSRRLSRARVRDALGYVEWKPPSPDAKTEWRSAAPVANAEWRSAAPDANAGCAGAVADGDAVPGSRARALQGFARWAVSIRRTALGRWLYRVVPESLINALKARLSADR